MRTRLITLLTTVLRAWFRGRAQPTPLAPRSILILKACCLGDVLLTTPLIATVRASYPEAQITYAVGPWSAPMVTTSRHVDRVLMLPDRWTLGAWLATLHVLKQHHFDLVFVPDRSPTLTLLTWLADIPQRIGLDSAGRGFAYTHRVAVPSFVIHEAEQYSKLATSIGLAIPPRRLFFFPTPQAELHADLLIKQHHTIAGPLVVLHPGGGQNPGMTLPRKRWFPERWANVADSLIQRCNAQILLVGGPGDEEAVAAVAAAMQTPAPSFVRRWDWNELGALLQRCNLFLGHDTGMMHLATAVATPTVAVFGPSDPQVYGPYSEQATFVWRPTYESPCFYNGIAEPTCPCSMQCMANVEVDDVVSAAVTFLSTSDKGSNDA